MKLVWKKNWLLTISHREYLLTQIWRGFTRHQRGAILGRAWLLIQPLAIIMVYTLIFTEVMHARLEVAQGPHAYSLFYVLPCYLGSFLLKCFNVPSNLC